jgi:hypothetical protein
MPAIATNTIATTILHLSELPANSHYTIHFSREVRKRAQARPIPPRTGLKRAINIMHGHQVNLPTLQHILEVIGKSKNRDGAYAFQSFQFYKLKNDPTVISITKSLSPFQGTRRNVCAGRRRPWGSSDATARLGKEACGRSAACIPGPRSDEAGALEIAQLKREVLRLKAERDILKNCRGPLPACAR